MTSNGVFAELIDLSVAHAVEVIVAVVVLADMINAKVIKLAFFATAHGRAVRAGLVAALPLARRRRIARGCGVLLAGDANTIEKFGVEFHGA